ncbi:MAG TPA: lipopolysaccharide kinase InaA family protein [Myxococcota bacterium]|nr:lipopolysaccharide kinase InaA family protein [Myxococcota bacterium]
MATRGRARAASEVPAGFRERSGAGQRIVFAEALAEDLEALGWLGPGGFERIGSGGVLGETGRGETVRCALPRSGVTIVVRSVLHGGLFGGFLRGALRSPERAFRELAVTAALREAGAPVPQPALAATRRAGLAWNARVATVFEPDAPDVVAFLARDPAPAAIVRAAEACGRAVRRFHDAGGTHADLHVKNLLLRAAGEAFEAIVVDLDGAGFGEPPDAARRMHELARLHRSARKRGLGDQIGFEANRALLHGYVGSDAALGAALSRHWPRERRRVAVHALGYRKDE